MSTWHYMKNGTQNGPVSLEEISALLASGNLASDALVWREGLASWVPAQTLPEFAGVARSTAAVPPPAPAAAPAAKGGNRTLIIILCVLGGMLLLIGGCVTTCTYIAAKKAREYSLQAQKNPAFASLSLIAAVSPEIQIVSKDEASGKITIRNKKTGETVTIDTNNYNADNIGKAFEKFAQTAQAAATKANGNSSVTVSTETITTSNEGAGSNSDAATTKAALAKMPAYLPAYPGASDSTGNFENVMGAMPTGTYSGYTQDKAGVVTEFYEKKLVAAGFTIVAKTSQPGAKGSTDLLVATAGGPNRNATVMATTQDDGRVQIEVNFVQTGG